MEELDRIDEWKSIAIPISLVLERKHEIASSSGTYIVFRSGIPAYVGYTERTLRQRILDHMTPTARRSSLLGEALCDSISEYSVYLIKEDIEQVLIKQFRPEFNRFGLSNDELTGKAKELLEESIENSKIWAERQKRRDRCFWQIMNQVDSILSHFRNSNATRLADSISSRYADNDEQKYPDSKEVWISLLNGLDKLKQEIEAKLNE